MEREPESDSPQAAPSDKPSRRPPSTSRKLRALLLTAIRKLRGPQDRLLRLLGSSPKERDALIAGRLERSANEATSYWLQMIVATGIATLGLVLDSAAIIIAAMLVAPLMAPIVALAMGLATGSPFLVLRSAVRIVMSVVVSIGGAALITVLLPFHELNAEIVGRTAPTVLDLVTAGFCALAGVYASLRPGSDTATTAAGTSIGISLVPPLCASGYGLGTTLWPVAGGAALLFLTNLVAIIVVGTIAFVAAGFNRVDVVRLERAELGKHQDARLTAAISRNLASIFESKAGPVLRFLMPLVLLAVVYVPLRQALDEVAWQVRVRAAVQEALGREQRKIVQSRVRAERHELDLRVVVLGTNSEANATRERLRSELETVAGPATHIEVLAIPDATAFAGLERSLLAAEAPLPVPPPHLETRPEDQLKDAHASIRSHVKRLWPAASAGEALVIELGTAEKGPLRVRVVHLGPELAADAVESLKRGLGAALERDVTLVDAAVPADTLTADDGHAKLVARVSAAVRVSASVDEISVCVVEPRPPKHPWQRVPEADKQLGAALTELLRRHPRVATEAGDGWSVRFVRGSCKPPEPAEADGSSAQ